MTIHSSSEVYNSKYPASNILTRDTCDTDPPNYVAFNNGQKDQNIVIQLTLPVVITNIHLTNSYDGQHTLR